MYINILSNEPVNDSHITHVVTQSIHPHFSRGSRDDQPHRPYSSEEQGPMRHISSLADRPQC